MLRNFLYLNVPALDGYLSSLEDGLRTVIEREETSTKDAGLEASVKVVSGKLGAGTESVERTTGQDTPEARFERLLAYARADSEALGWIEVLDADTDLADVGFGALVEAEAEFFIPSIIRTLADSRGLQEAMDMFDALEPLADMFGLDMDGMPDKAQRDGMRSVVGAMKANLVAVGELDGSDWKVAGEVLSQHLRAEVEGPARFVGKVAKKISEGQGRHLMALPGTSLMPREARRELERKKPENADDESFLQGPALVLDLLAIWR